jgi:hypothetical protein
MKQGNAFQTPFRVFGLEWRSEKRRSLPDKANANSSQVIWTVLEWGTSWQTFRGAVVQFLELPNK